MPRYIDADALFAKANENVQSNPLNRCVQLLDLLINAPIADVVEVVRCENCKHFVCTEQMMFCNEYGGRLTATDFCSRAERKEQP